MWKIFSVPWGSALYKFHCFAETRKLNTLNTWDEQNPVTNWISTKCCRSTCGSPASHGWTKWARSGVWTLQKQRPRGGVAVTAPPQAGASPHTICWETPTSLTSPHTASGRHPRNVTCPEPATWCLSCSEPANLRRRFLLMETPCSWGTNRTNNSLTRRMTNWRRRTSRHRRWEIMSARHGRVCLWTRALIVVWRRPHRPHLWRHVTDPPPSTVCLLTTVPQTQAPSQLSVTARNGNTGTVAVPRCPLITTPAPTTTTPTTPTHQSPSASGQKQWSRWNRYHRGRALGTWCRPHHPL
jgi:hypothetical protein